MAPPLWGAMGSLAGVFNQLIVAREKFRIRELLALKARFPDSAFAHFVVASRGICSSWDSLVSAAGSKDSERVGHFGGML